MRPSKLSLAGFRGIKEGLGLDQVEIEFSGNGSDVIALCGDNGTGKSTVMDNLQPFREMPSRGGSYYDHVTGEARKELVFQMDGKVYRSIILIEPKTKRQEAYLYVQRDGEWSPLNDGKTGTYDEQVETLMGSSRLFFASIFRCQAAKPISAHTMGELKELFSELLMLDRYQTMADRAKERRRKDETKAEGTSVAVEALTVQVADLDAKRVKKKELMSQLEAVKREIGANEEILGSLRKELSSLEARKAVQEKDVKRGHELRADIRTIEGKIEMLKDSLIGKTKNVGLRIEEQRAKVARADKIVSGKDEIEGKVEEEGQLEGEKESLRQQADKARLDLERAEQKVEGLNRLRSRIASLESQVGAETEARLKEIAHVEKDIDRAKQTAEKLETVPCTGMDIALSCPLLEDAVSARDGLSQMDKQLGELASAEWTAPSLVDLNQAKDDCKHLQQAEGEYGERKKLLADLRQRMNDIDTRLSEVRKFSRLLPELEVAQKTIGEAKQEVDRLEREKVELKTEIDEQVAMLNDEVAQKQAEEKRILESLDTELMDRIEEHTRKARVVEDELERLYRNHVDLASSLGMVEQSLKSIADAREEIDRLNGELKVLGNEVSEWLLLERAIGKDGLIALEIDDAGPAISKTANELLQACFGPRFTVKIETTRPTKDGKKMMEVFDIKVLDSESDEEKTILALSGGEKVWIESAITQAIAIRNKESSGRNFLTCLQDEVDGALSKQNKERFFRMKKKAMELGGFEETIFISQDPDVWRKAETRVVFEKGRGITVEA